MAEHTIDAFWRSPEWVTRAEELTRSFRQVTGRDLVTPSEDMAEPLYNAAMVVVAHGTEEDPILNYGNAAALSLWGVDAVTLCRMPSRLTAEPVHREERAAMLARVHADGYIDDYAGVRITADGRRFEIRQAIVWNVTAVDGSAAGQAAAFDQWTWLAEEKTAAG